METRRLSELTVNPLNPRGVVVDDDSLRELAESIKAHGVLQPILVTPTGVIVAGHRRAKACEIATVDEIPVVVHDLDETEQIQIMLVENLQRQGLTALQTAKAYKMLVDKGLSVRQISIGIGYRPESISRHLNILELPEGLHSSFDGEYGIPLGGIRYLLELPEPQKRLDMGRRCKEENWSITEIREAVARAMQLPVVLPETIKRAVRHVAQRNSEPLTEDFFQQEPSFAEYVAARKVVMYEYEKLRSENQEGRLNIASDEMVARIVHRSCAYFRTDDELETELPVDTEPLNELSLIT